MELKEQICRIFPREIREALRGSGLEFDKLCAIRIRAGKPVIFYIQDEEYFLDRQRSLTRQIKDALCFSMEDIREMMEFISNYSLYAFDEELRQGYLTIQGGHRIGIAGNTILERGMTSAIRYISCLNVRVAHQVHGCADKCMPYLYEQGVLQNTLVVSGCGRGKTTILRDMIRQISNGTDFHKGVTVGVVDERSEIAACYHGAAQNDLGIRTDVMDGCPKALGIRMLIRSMAPEVVAVDELGGTGDLEAVRNAIASGSKLLATIHASSYKELRCQPFMNRLLGERLITRLVFLAPEGKQGRIARICDGGGGEILLC